MGIFELYGKICFEPTSWPADNRSECACPPVLKNKIDKMRKNVYYSFVLLK